jgi:hypothetical protein
LAIGSIAGSICFHQFRSTRTFVRKVLDVAASVCLRVTV